MAAHRVCPAKPGFIVLPRGRELDELETLRTTWRRIISAVGPEGASAGDERALKSKADLAELFHS